MKKRKLPAILALIAAVVLAVSAMAQTPAAPPQSDTGSAQSETSSSAGQEATTPDQSEMPATASPLALVALLGAGSLGAGFTARRFAKR